jgi:hypothetical protein
MFIGHSEIVAFLLYRFNADKPAPLLRRWILALYYHKFLGVLGVVNRAVASSLALLIFTLHKTLPERGVTLVGREVNNRWVRRKIE